MSESTFQILLHCRYIGDDNTIDQLHVEHLVSDSWQQLDLDTYSDDFDIFIYGLLACQHTSFKNNAAEYGLTLESSEGLITVITNKLRSIETLSVDFKGKLKNGKANKEIVDSISARMELCPVAINLKDIANNHVAASFEAG